MENTHYAEGHIVRINKDHFSARHYFPYKDRPGVSV